MVEIIMPLSPPAKREHIHSRDFECRGYRRDDGLWDIEGHIADTKTYGFPNDYRGEIGPGEKIHGMFIRMTVDDDFVIRAMEVVTDDSPFAMCGDITSNFQGLVGETVGAGWRQRIRRVVGGTHGCTHLTELMGVLAATAFQTIYPLRNRTTAEEDKAADGEVKDGGAGDGPQKPRSKPPMLDTCHALAATSPIVQKYWPEFYENSPESAIQDAS